VVIIEDPLRLDTELSLHDGFFIEIIEFDLFLALDLEYLTPSSVSFSSASNSFFALPLGMSGFKEGGELSRFGFY